MAFVLLIVAVVLAAIASVTPNVSKVHLGWLAVALFAASFLVN